MKSSGFSLLETIIYCALFSVLMTGALVAFYALLSSAELTRHNTDVLTESVFIERKLRWAFSGAIDVVLISSTELKISRPDLGSSLTFFETSSHLYLARGTSTPIILTNPNLPITDLTFTYVAPKVSVRYRVGGSPFLFEAYIH